MNAAAGARARAAYVLARILREGVTLDVSLHDALANAPAGFAPAVRSLSYGAVRGYYRHEAILGRLLSQPVRSLDGLVRAILSVALFERVFLPLVGLPHGLTGCRPPEVRPSPPPCGWSTGFIVTPRLCGRWPSHRLRPALPSEAFI